MAKQLTYPIQRNYHGSRYYEVREGVLLRSVTTILNVIAKPALLPWVLKQARLEIEAIVKENKGKKMGVTVSRALIGAVERSDEIKDAAADYGTRVHDAVAHQLKGDQFVVPEDIRDVVDKFHDFLTREDIEPLIVEGIIYSEEHGIYAGTVDIAGRRRGKRNWGVAIDWKSGNHIYPEQILQSAAYAKGLEEKLGIRFREAWVVRCNNKSGEIEYEEAGVAGDAFDAAFETFVHAQKLDDGLRSLRQTLDGKDPNGPDLSNDRS